ncbi:MAG: phosphoenolpyruvate--protein phosphotransferase [Gammaproteobacteria bacterium]|nr:phosphoenolpyruvate--protein phosphotransferase [Gammaproteobacteria bacterium]
MTLALHGLGISRGIAIGPAHIVERDQLDIPEYEIDAGLIDDEIERLKEAVMAAQDQLRAIRRHVPAAAATEITALIDAHLLMLDDAALIHEPLRLIREQRRNAEWALKSQRDALVRVFEEMDDSYLRTRRDDVAHVVNRIQRILLKHSPLRHEQPDSRLTGYIIFADDLTPADTVLMQHHGIAAFVTEYGGPTSHTSILARSLGIPAIVGLHQAHAYIRDEEPVIVDGTRGVVLAGADPTTLEFYRSRREQDQRYYSGLIRLKDATARTLDGVRIELQANVELPADFDNVLRVGADGIGLYRTEFLFMNRDVPPDEDEQYRNYLGAVQVLGRMPVTIRTLDLGGDKEAGDAGRRTGSLAANPALGLRAVRLCLKKPALFRPQLRAILRASAAGDVRLMIPMLSNTQEMEQVLGLIDEIRTELRAEGAAFNPDLPVGGMIEVPAAAVCADIFARQLDFLSIGTNDLIQYTMAIDRVNDEVNYLYDPLHPAVLRLVHGVIAAGSDAGIPVAMCGEMAGDVRYVRLLLALGLRCFSVHPASLLEVKQIIMASDLGELGSLAQRALAATCGADVGAIVEEYRPVAA